MQKHLLLSITCVFFLCAVATAQIVTASHYDALAAAKKKGGTLSTSQSSGSGAGSNLCWAQIDAGNLNMLDSNTAILCLNDSLILNVNFSDESSFGDAQWYYNNYQNPIGSYNDDINSVLVKKTGIYIFHTGLCDVGINMTSTIPLGDFPSKTIFCPEGSVQLTAPAGQYSSYQWYKGNTAISGKKQKTYTANSTGNYYVRVKDSNNCVLNSDKINVTVYNPPAHLKISGDTCVNSILNLDAYKGNLTPDTIKWYRNGQLISTVVNKGNVVAAGNGKGHGQKQLNQPYGIFLDSDKTFYVADYNNYRVMKYMPGSTGGVRIGDTLKYYGHPTDVVKDGNDLFVSTTNSLAKISSITESLGGYNFWGISIGSDHDPHVTFDALNGQPGSAMVFYKDGSGYYSSFSDAGNNGSGSSLANLNYPNGIYQDSDYNLFIADNYVDSLNNNIGRIVKWHILDDSGQLIAGGKNFGNAPDQIWFAADVTFDKLGNMYVSDAVNNRVQLWKPGANHGITIISGFTPWGIAVDNDFKIYVVDQTNNRVLKFPSLLYNTIEANKPGTYKAIATYPGGCTVTSYSFTVKNCNALANNDADINLKDASLSFIINPNPVQNILNIHLKNAAGNTSISIIDITGRKLKTQQINASGNYDLSFNVSTLPAGIYIAEVMHNDKKLHLKFVKQ